MKESSETYLREYEQDMITSLFFSYSRPIPATALKEIWGILMDEGQSPESVNYGCSSCILRLLKSAGRFYFRTFPERVPEKYKDRKI